MPSPPSARPCAILNLRGHFEDVREALPGAKPDAGVLDGDAQRAVLDARPQRDAARRVGVLRGIGQEIRQHLRQPNGVCIERRQLRRQLDRQAVTFAVDQRARGFNRGVDDRAEVDALQSELQLAARDARNVEQVVEQPRHVLHLPMNDLA